MKWNNILDKDHGNQKTIGYFQKKRKKKALENNTVAIFKIQSGIGSPEKNIIYVCCGVYEFVISMDCNSYGLQSFHTHSFMFTDTCLVFISYLCLFSKVIFRLNPLSLLSLIHSHNRCIINENLFQASAVASKSTPADSELGDGQILILWLTLLPQSPRIQHPNKAEQELESALQRIAII